MECTLLPCSDTEHFDENKDRCEPNVCYCTYGEVTDKCYGNNTHSCDALKSRSNMQPTQGTDVIECS